MFTNNYSKNLNLGTLDKKYERRRKRDIKSRRRDKNDEKREARKRPNYFVAIQITNPEVIHHYQTTKYFK